MSPIKSIPQKNGKAGRSPEVVLKTTGMQSTGALRVIRDLKPESRYRGSGIGKLVREWNAVSGSVQVQELALDIPFVEGMQCLAVLNEKGVAVGIIVKRDFQEGLVKLYWRDIYRKHRLDEHMILTKSFDVGANPFSVGEELREELSGEKIRYYLAYRPENGEKKFYGIFSSLDLFRHLSEITQKDMALATSLASRVTPDVYGEKFPNGEIHGYSRMARGVGGDYYSVRRVGEDRRLLSLCDVSGKGVSASLIATLIAGMFQVFDFDGGKLGVFLEELNAFLIETFEQEKFVTGIFVEVEEKTGLLRIYDYGHSLIFLHRRSHFHRIRTGGDNPPLGIASDRPQHPNEFQLEAGDTLILLTDGILEQTNDKGEEFGSRRVAELIHRAKRRGEMDSVGKVLVEEALAFKEGQPQLDDMSVLLLTFHEI
ncbi:MAG: serine/threonine-protein phosphatase [Spirochaetia bacterium]|nr:serine/threonine-protein phosphatase [Spirochaetia bacterium]